MTSLQCVNCNVRLFRMRRHALFDESADLINTIRLWTYPRDITPTDHICHACWQLASYSSSSENMPTRQVGHHSICVVCGRSILRISHRRILIEGANEEQQRVANVVSSWIQPRQLCSEDEACVPCWLRARRTAVTIPVEDIQPPAPDYVDDDHSALMCVVCGRSLSSTTSDEEWNPENIFRLLELQQTSSMNEVCGVCWAQAQDLSLRVTEGQQERLQQIVLPNIRRAADTARHCVFQECTEAERNLVPEETRREVLIRYQYFIPRGARICSLHREEANYENLYTAEYSLNNFTSAHIEDIIFILTTSLSQYNVFVYRLKSKIVFFRK
ncbi:unnamed protein product [Euphydryas editha]|uniref:Uncharacterized protein n=1 Tax=Euphydryas editha TaxID=104508 RepID=A0AAU9UE75_EUPED|nr:unnamed protein product [Euphydryas editha]